MPSIATRYGTEPVYPVLAMPLPEAQPRPVALVCGGCALLTPLNVAGAVAGRCIRRDGRPGVIGFSVAACGRFVSAGTPA